MRKNYIIADSGATKCQWTLVLGNQKKTITTIGISPYFLTTDQIVETIAKGFNKKVDTDIINAVYFYGTGLSNPLNVASIKKALAEPKQEPVAWLVYTREGKSAFVTDNPAQIHPSQRALPLYTAPHHANET